MAEGQLNEGYGSSYSICVRHLFHQFIPFLLLISLS